MSNGSVRVGENGGSEQKRGILTTLPGSTTGIVLTGTYIKQPHLHGPRKMSQSGPFCIRILAAQRHV